MADYDMDTHPMVADTTILPAQYFDRAQKLGPEARMWFATLTDALRIIQKGPSLSFAKTRIYNDAIEWIAETTVTICSFEYVCEIFDLDSDSIRRGLATANPVPRNRPTGMTANRVSIEPFQRRNHQHGITRTSN